MNADETLLKTMIRANPGVILLNKGTIIGNWNSKQLPAAAYFNGDLNSKQILSITKTSDKRLSIMLISFLGIALALAIKNKKKER